MSKKRQTVRLVCWKEDRAAEFAAGLESNGFEVDFRVFSPSTMKDLSEDPPGAVVIDLGRLPAQGRDVAVAMRTRAGTRHLPVVFVDGAAEKVRKIRQLLPDAVFTRCEGLQQAIEDAIAEPPVDPVVPSSVFAGYSGTPLPKKLGIKAGTTVALINAPDNFSSTLGRLPGDTEIASGPRKGAEVTLWFVLSSEELEREIDDMAAVAGDGRLWICWPKTASGVPTDVTQNTVRATGLAAGIVDFKICAIDETWSGLCFTKRKK